MSCRLPKWRNWVAAGEPVEPTDPAPASLMEVGDEWDLTLEG